MRDLSKRPSSGEEAAKRSDRVTLTVFLAQVVFGGANAVAIRFANDELAPLWGATLRFGVAALVFIALMAVARQRPPRGRALTGLVVFGVVNFGAGYGLVHWGLVGATASLTQIILALVPLITLLMAAAIRLERFRPRGLAGALVALAGIAVVFGQQLRADVPAWSMAAVFGTAVCWAAATIIVKWFPPSHPFTTNAVAMTVGCALLFGASLALGEPRAMPAEASTWLALGYLAIVGSVGLFLTYLFVLRRWTATAASYQFVLYPLSTIVIAAAIAGERVTLSLLAGGALVLAGVYVGAFGRRR